MAVAQAPTQRRGIIILGRILPCTRRKRGHFECLSISRGPFYNKSVKRTTGAPGAPRRRKTRKESRAYEVVVEVEAGRATSYGIRARWEVRRQRALVLVDSRVSLLDGEDGLVAVIVSIAAVGRSGGCHYRGRISTSVTHDDGFFLSNDSRSRYTGSTRTIKSKRKKKIRQSRRKGDETG